MNILVTGANGQLGCCLRNSALTTKDNYIFTGVDKLDITDKDAISKMVNDNNVDIIINCAAYTNVDKAEDDIESAEKLNAEAVRNLAEAIKAVNGTFFHISTDYVFGGDIVNTPLNENDPASPTGVYGKTKLHGEQAIADVSCKALIFRTAWLYSEYGKNFVKTMLNLTATKPELKVVVDQIGSPTYAQDLADTIFNIIENRKFKGNEGIYHYSNEGACSWYDLTMHIIDFTEHLDCNVQPCLSHEFPSKVTRPSYSVLDKTKIKQTFGIKIPYWVDSLARCLNNLENFA